MIFVTLPSSFVHPNFSAAAFIKAAYGGDGLPSATFNDTFVPDSWVQNGQTSLYRNVIAPTDVVANPVAAESSALMSHSCASSWSSWRRATR